MSDKSQDANLPILEEVNRRLFHIENAYLVRRELNLHFNRAVNAEASKKYLAVINSHKGFFVPVLESTLCYNLIGLNALLSSNDKKSLQKLVNKMQADGIADFRQDLANLRTKHEQSLNTITDLRMEYFAHFGEIDLNSVGAVSEDAYIELFEDTKIFINKINGVFGRSVWYMDGDANETIKDTHDLMNNLLRGEAQRVSEIDVDLTSKIFEDGKSRWMKDEQQN